MKYALTFAVVACLFIAGCDRGKPPATGPDTSAHKMPDGRASFDTKPTDVGSRVARTVPTDTGKATPAGNEAPGKDDFPTGNGSAAAGWLLRSWKRMDRAKDNEIAATEAKKAFESDLASLAGKRVRWAFMSKAGVKKVGDGRAHIPSVFIEGPSPAGIYVVGVPDGVDAEGYDKLAFDSGIVVPLTPAVKDITHDYRVEMEATVKRVDFQPSSDRVRFIVYVADPAIIKADRPR